MDDTRLSTIPNVRMEGQDRRRSSVVGRRASVFARTGRRRRQVNRDGSHDGSHDGDRDGEDEDEEDDDDDDEEA